MVWGCIMGRRKTNLIVVQGNLNAQGYIWEHIWDYLGRKVRARGNVHNLRDLENAFIQEWNNIPNVVIRRYVRSMQGRLPACINSRGGNTRY